MNPLCKGGKILKGTKEETAADKKFRYLSKPCDR